jgi:hypothetical protein
MEDTMTTAETVAERALDVARSDDNPDVAVMALLDAAGERRVAIVRARQLLEERSGASEDPATARASALLDAALARIPV